jgi:glycosyltransferase 2 family protein
MSRMKRWQFWLGLLISLVFLYLALRGLQLQQLGTAIRDANYIWLIPGVAIYFVAVWARAWRWHYLLKPLKVLKTAELFPTVCIGYFGNNILPARAGELLRAIILKKDEQVPVSASLATILVERVFDGVVMLAFVFVNLPELARLTSSSGFIGDIRTLAVVGSVIFMGVLFVFLIAAMYPERSGSILEKILRKILPQRHQEKLIAFFERFIDGLAALRSPHGAWMVFFTSLVIWLLETGKYWFLMHAFPFKVSFFALMLMNGIVNLATTIPSAPGYVGTFDAPGIAVLQAYQVPKTTAAAYTLVLHAALWLPITALGGYYLFKKGIHWNTELESAKAEV